MVTVIYLLVVIVVVLAINDGGFLSFLAGRTNLASSQAASEFVAENGEVAMARAAQYYLGEAGFYIFIVGALLSMISAANATVLAGSRVKLAMAERGHLPEIVGRINPRSGVPVFSVALTAGLILTFFLIFGVLFGRLGSEGAEGGQGQVLGLELLAHFADFMLLSGLLFVNIALIQSRRKYPDRERLFRVPWVPWIPMLAVGSNLVLLASLELTSLALGLLAVGVGGVLWFVVINRA